MFKKLVEQVSIPDPAGTLVSLHPIELTGLLEQAWNMRVSDTTLEIGHPNRRSNVPGISIGIPSPVLVPPSLTGQIPGPAQPFTNVLSQTSRAGIPWDHLIYAYMIENTRIYEIFRRVVHEFLNGEKLGIPREDTQLWLRSAEELFYRDTPPFSITTLSSHIRPDVRALRRNVYQRMFGMDLNHGTDENAPYHYVRAEAANNEFVPTFEELLREVWVGFSHRNNQVGARPTDDTKIEELAHKLHDMLLTRRQRGNLSREEFFFVSMMSWFHLTVDNDLPIIRDLRADGESPEQRLFKVAQLVGLPAHGLSRSYFQIADAISAVLIAIETGDFHTSGTAPTFYDPTPPNTLANDMNTIITHWSLITGRDMKARKVATT